MASWATAVLAGVIGVDLAAAVIAVPHGPAIRRGVGRHHLQLHARPRDRPSQPRLTGNLINASWTLLTTGANASGSVETLTLLGQYSQNFSAISTAMAAR